MIINIWEKFTILRPIFIAATSKFFQTFLRRLKYIKYEYA